MRKPPATKTIEFNEVKVKILSAPPPHVLFLGSQLQSAEGGTDLTSLARVGGLAALCVRSIGDEEVVFEGGMPRDLDALANVGRGFIMAAFEHLGGSYEDLAEFFQLILDTYQKDGVGPNPT